MSGLRGLLLVARHAFAGSLRGRRVLALLALIGLPVLLAWVGVSQHRTFEMENFLVLFALAMLQLSVPLGALLLGTAALGDEIEGRTITYLFTRPLPRPALFAGRVVGATSSFALLLAGATSLMMLVLYPEVTFRGGDFLACAGIVAAGAFVYGAIFATLRVFFRRALFLGFFLAFIFEVIVSKIPFGSITKASVWHHLLVLATRRFDGRFAPEKVLRSVQADETAGGSALVLAAVFAVALAVGCWAVKTREVRVPAAAA